MAYEILHDYVPRENIESTVKLRVEDGWTVLYVIPMPQIQYNNHYSQSPTLRYANADGTMGPNVLVVNASPAPLDPIFELVFLKKDWDKEPCPRCSYPFPNEDNIGRDA